MTAYTTIEVNPKIMMGKPVIKDTRITVEMILEEVSQGVSVEELVQAHPRLRAKHIFAALAFAKDII